MKFSSFVLVALVLTLAGPGVQAQTDPFIGQIIMHGFGFCPTDWLPCDGTGLLISQYTPLYALIGFTYGGDGTTTFRLPDLRGRTPVHTGVGAGLTPISMGQAGGAETVNINIPNLPEHKHAFALTTSPAATAAGPGACVSGNGFPLAGCTTNTTAVTGATNAAGAGAPLAIRNPYLGVRYCIAVRGTFPFRD